jgi:8-oxo-dGTP pyrophosphatase MutT (NUDIX family)
MQNEEEVACAIREVYEKTSFDIKDKIDPTVFVEKEVLSITCVVIFPLVYVCFNIYSWEKVNIDTRYD